ncbi:MAG: hypothetical protein FWD43_05515 [Coriobacteriia bacterium]|nr:hypothetical protein [Coriobacteriia bacterium]
MEILEKIYSAIDTSNMSWFTFVPSWVIQDAVIILLAVVAIGFVLKHEKKPIPILLEFFCFIFLYAAVYENFATVTGWYGYGQSLIMVFNVPMTVPIIEYLFVYVTLRFCRKIRIPTWATPFFVGAFGVLADIPLDPLSMQQVAISNDVLIGRWTWFISAADASVMEVPIYNFTGWMLLCGYAAAFLLLGRHWFQKSGENRIVGILYPPLCMLAGLVVMCSPLSSFLLWLGPWFTKGGWTEYLMLGLCFAALIVLLVAWRGRMRKRLTWKDEWIILIVFGVFHLTVLVFGLIGGHWNVVLFGLPFSMLQMGIIVWGFTRRKGTA